MRLVRSWVLRLGELFRKERREKDLAAEIESHLQMHIEDNLRMGMSPEIARREALTKLGGIEQTKENYRKRRGLPVFRGSRPSRHEPHSGKRVTPVPRP